MSLVQKLETNMQGPFYGGMGFEHCTGKDNEVNGWLEVVGKEKRGVSSGTGVVTYLVLSMVGW